MKKFLKIFLLSISIISLGGCVSTKNLNKANDIYSLPTAVLGSGYNTALYKAKIEVSDQYFSGLFYFKALEDSSFRIVFLSEIGLNLLDLEYKNNTFKTIKCQEFINKDVILNTLKNDIKLLIDSPKDNVRPTVFKTEDEQIALIKVKDKTKRYYFYGEDKKLSRIIQKKGLKHIEVILPEYNNAIPQKIDIRHKRIKLSIGLKLLKVK